MMSEAVQSEYKGSPMIILRNSSQDQFPFQFGVRKAKLVLAHIEDIRKFVQQCEVK
jgi:dUTPase